MSSKRPQSRRGPDLPMPFPQAQVGAGEEGPEPVAQPSQEGQEQEMTQGWGRLVRAWADHREHTQRRQQRGSHLCLPQEEAMEGPGKGPDEAVASLKAAPTGISRGIRLSCQRAELFSPWKSRHHGSLGEDALRDPSLSRLPVSTSPQVSAPTKLKDGTQMWGSHQGTPAMPASSPVVPAAT